MTHDEEVKTIRDVIDNCITDKIGRQDYERVIGALDSLAVESKPLDPEIKAVVQENFWELAGKPAVEPSEEARELVHKIRIGFAEMNYCPVLVLSDTDAADLITARDDRIRRECADKIIEYIQGSFDPVIGSQVWSEKGIRAAIMGGKE